MKGHIDQVDESPSSFASGKRLQLKDVPGLSGELWNLLPGESMGSEQLESSLAWQETIYSEWFGESRLEIRWCPNLSNPSRAAKVLGSIAVQSLTRFRLVIVVAEEAADREVREFGEFVGESGSLSLRDLLLRLGLSTRVELFSGKEAPRSAADWILALNAEDCLHPMALFCLLKSVRENSVDVVGFFETLTDESTGGPHAVHMNRGASLYSVLGEAGVSRSLCFSNEAWELLELDRSGFGRVSSDQPATAWSSVLLAMAKGLSISRVPLALTAVEMKRGQAVEHGCGGDTIQPSIEVLAQSKGLPLQEWSYDGLRGSGRPVPLPSSSKIAVIIPFRDQEELTSATFRSLASQSISERVRLVAVDNGSVPEVADRLRTLALELFGEERLTWLTIDAPFNFATLNNRGVAACDEPHLLFLNNDVEFLEQETLAHLQGFLEWPEVGMVGGALYYPDGQLQAAGIRFGPAGPEVVRDPDGGALIFREVEALTFACALARRSAFEDAGRLDEILCPNGFGDALLGHRMGEAGWRILCDPSVSIRHHESKSRGIRPEELERVELSKEGIPIYLYGTEFSRIGQEMVHRFGRSTPTFGKRIYRAFKAFRKELWG